MKSSKLIEDQMIRRGAVLGHGHLSEGVTTADGLIPLAAKPFALSEKGNQTYIALVKKIQLESDVKRLMELEGKTGSVSKVFNRMTTIVGQSQSQTRNRVLTNLTNEQLADAIENPQTRGNANVFFHGTDIAGQRGILETGADPKRSPLGVKSEGIGFFISRDIKKAQGFGDSIVEIKTKRNAKIATPENLRGDFFTDFGGKTGLLFNSTDIVKAAKAQGFDIVDLEKFHVLTNTPNSELAVLNVDSIKITKHNPELVPNIPDDVMSEVLHRTITDSAFPLTLASKRLWWGSRPELQAVTQFKVWSADQTRFIYKDVIKYGVQTGDWSRLTRFILGTWLTGELYNIARDELLNKDESVLSKAKGGTKTEIALAIRDDLIDGGIVGFLADFTYGIGDWAAGPTINTVSNALAAPFEAQGAATFVDTQKKFLLNDIPALRQAQGIMDNLDSIFDKNNLTEDYARWQGRSSDFRKKQGDSVSSNIFLRSIRGAPQKRITEKSLSLEMIARQVLVGDYDDAAQHIKAVIKDTDIDKLENTIQSFKQSMRSNSPFGNISKEKLPFFITQFSAEEAVKGIDLQKQWLSGYLSSMKIAFTELKAEGFKEDAKAKVDAYKTEMEPVIKTARERLKEIQEGLK